MKKVYPIILQTRTTSIHRLSSNKTGRYENIIKEIVKDDIEFVNIPPYESFSFLIKTPIENDMLPEQNVKFREFIVENIFKNRNIIDNYKFLSLDTILFFDLSTIGREPLIFSLLLQLKSLLENDQSKNRIILYINDLPTTFDLSVVYYNDFILNEQLIVFDKKGRFANPVIERTLNKPKIERLLRQQEPSNVDLIKNKMISKIGHFRRTDYKGKDICFRSYFDGQFCIKEISDYISNYIRHKIENYPLLIIYYSANSIWLKDVIYIVVEKNLFEKVIYIEINDLKDTTINGFIHKYGKRFELMFVTDLLNTGETFKNHYSNIINTIPRDNSLVYNINFISVLNNRRRSSETKNHNRIFHIGNKTIIVHYILDVDVIQKHTDNCELCKLEIPHTLFEEDYSLKLTSFEFWELCHNTKYIPEQHVPERTNRIKIPYHPNILEWIELNGPYIAYKFKKVLDYNEISINNLIIVLPDESKSKGKNLNFIDTPSGKLVYCLSLVHDVNYITIPRLEIDFYSNNEIDDSIYNKKDLWIRQLIDSDGNILIVDESHVEGGTFNSIKKILSFLNKEPVGYFPIIDFNPRLTEINITISPELKYLNLYEFQLI